MGRLLARLGGRRLTRTEAQRAADRLVPAGRSWVWNQALFDLGATVCTRRAPACARCPLQAHCAWRGEGPDPADGSAGVSAVQAPFEGSDRQCRGRLVEALRSGPQPATAAAHLMGLEDDPPRARPHPGVAPARRPRDRARRRAATTRLSARRERRRRACLPVRQGPAVQVDRRRQESASRYRGPEHVDLVSDPRCDTLSDCWS